MPLSERDWAKEPLPAERIEPQNSENLADDLEDVELVLTGDGYKVEKRQHVVLGWRDVVFWIVVLVSAKSCS